VRFFSKAWAHLAFLGVRDRPVDAKTGLAGDVHHGATLPAAKTRLMVSR